MKNKLVLAFGVLLIWGLVLIGCDTGTGGTGTGGTGTGGNPFIGTWKGASFTDQYFTFRADLTLTYGNSAYTFSGTYSYSGNSATISSRGATYPIEIGSDGTFTYLSQKFKK
jgi:hypothetical protein